jgi:DNA-binding PadR family transcriptional regulator
MTPDRIRARVEALLPLAPRDYLILFALSEGACHGHLLLRRLEAASGGLPFDPANLYRSLRKLERDALVEETDDGDAAKGPPRRCYRLTTLGRSVFAAEADRLARLTDAARARRLIPAPGRGR